MFFFLVTHTQTTFSIHSYFKNVLLYHVLNWLMFSCNYKMFNQIKKYFKITQDILLKASNTHLRLNNKTIVIYNIFIADNKLHKETKINSEKTTQWNHLLYIIINTHYSMIMSNLSATLVCSWFRCVVAMQNNAMLDGTGREDWLLLALFPMKVFLLPTVCVQSQIKRAILFLVHPILPKLATIQPRA